MSRSVKHWSLTMLREKLIKIGAKVVRHARYATFQMAEVTGPRELFAAILERIQRFGVSPPLLRRKRQWRRDENMKIPTRRWLALGGSAGNRPPQHSEER